MGAVDTFRLVFPASPGPPDVTFASVGGDGRPLACPGLRPAVVREAGWG
jgi:hypothetical protein